LLHKINLNDPVCLAKIMSIIMEEMQGYKEKKPDNKLISKLAIQLAITKKEVSILLYFLKEKIKLSW
jgi:hypothetical protein